MAGRALSSFELWLEVFMLYFSKNLSAINKFSCLIPKQNRDEPIDISFQDSRLAICFQAFWKSFRDEEKKAWTRMIPNKYFDSIYFRASRRVALGSSRRSRYISRACTLKWISRLYVPGKKLTGQSSHKCISISDSLNSHRNEDSFSLQYCFRVSFTLRFIHVHSKTTWEHYVSTFLQYNNVRKYPRENTSMRAPKSYESSPSTAFSISSHGR